jgi:hypothetical protein
MRLHRFDKRIRPRTRPRISAVRPRKRSAGSPATRSTETRGKDDQAKSHLKGVGEKTKDAFKD